MRPNSQNMCKDYTMEEWFACTLDWEKRQLLNSNCSKGKSTGGASKQRKPVQNSHFAEKYEPISQTAEKGF